MITLYYLREVWIGECEDYISKYQSAVSWVLSFFFFFLTFCSMFLIFPDCFHLLKCNAASQNRFRWMMNDDVVVSFKRLRIQPSAARDTANLSLCDYKSPNCNPLFFTENKIAEICAARKGQSISIYYLSLSVFCGPATLAPFFFKSSFALSLRVSKHFCSLWNSRKLDFVKSSIVIDVD